MLEKLKLDFKVLRELDFVLFITMIVTVFFGCVNIYLATKGEVGFAKVEKQLIWLGVSLVAIYFVLLVDYMILQNYAFIFYVIGIILLIITIVAGATVNGATGWIKIGGFTMQPSEVAKIGIIVMLAKKIQDMEGKVNELKNFFILAAYAIVPVILIVKEPDMGMTMVCFFIVLGMFFIAGLNIRVIGGGLVALFLSIVLIWNSGLIEPYQKKRITSFLDPAADELNSGLQLTQSTIGIGSGGFLGSGVSFSIDSPGGYVSQNVPEKETDFIFAVIGETWGTVGAIFLLAMYGIIIYRIITISRTSKDVFGQMICVGLAAYFLFAIYQNIGMTIGLMPITGITLPLISYGGSSLFTTMLSLGLILNIGMRRKKINF